VNVRAVAGVPLADVETLRRTLHTMKRNLYGLAP
jgi:hypothetical protein